MSEHPPNKKQRVLARRPKRHHNYDEWETPSLIYWYYNDKFHFDLDVCASSTNKKVSPYYTKKDNALEQPWKATVAWCNPPYSDIEPWIRKGKEEILKQNCEKVVYLLPNWTDSNWFQNELIHEKCEWLPYKVKFLNKEKKVIGSPKFCNFVYVMDEDDVFCSTTEEMTQSDEEVQEETQCEDEEPPLDMMN